VYLPQVHVVGVQARQGPVQLVEQRPTGPVRHAVAQSQPGLGRQHEVRAAHGLAEQGTEQFLGLPADVRRGGVQQGSAGVGERGEHLRGFARVGQTAPGGGPQRKPGDGEPTAAKSSLFHRSSPITFPAATPQLRVPSKG
jgi:hypothetical protein